MDFKANFKLVPIPAIPRPLGGPAPSPLGPLAQLGGTWKGTGFNQIFRPFFGAGSDNFLELNLTQETLELTEIPGEIPNRGMVQADISLFGLTYLQQVADVNVLDSNGNPSGIHIEPGIWINVPLTTNPNDPPTVARLANIPHGTSLVAQGTATVIGGPPTFPAVDITPFTIGNPGNRIPFASQNLSNPSAFRSPPANIVGITQAMVTNPNSVLAAALVGKTITSTTVLQISTSVAVQPVPSSGGGTSNIAFLAGAGGTPNAMSAEMDATFWISTFTDSTGVQQLMLQYSQRVLLNFNTLSWPHVSVASLIKQQVIPPGKGTKDAKDAKDHKPEVKEHKPEIKEHKPEIKEHKPEIKEHKPELKEHKPELKEIDVIPSPIPQPEPTRAAPQPDPAAVGTPFIQPAERPAVGEGALARDPAKANT
jgi:hypothetical protein